MTVKELIERLKKMPQFLNYIKMEEDKFIFLDEEKNYMLVIGDRKIFEREYCRLQNKYRENDWDFAGFYDELEEKLKLKGVKLVADIDILCHNDFCFN